MAGFYVARARSTGRPDPVRMSPTRGPFDVDHITDLVGQLHRVKNLVHGCESLSVASTDGLVMATTHDEPRKGDFVAAVTSLLLTNSAGLLAPLKAGECRALDFRGDR